MTTVSLDRCIRQQCKQTFSIGPLSLRFEECPRILRLWHDTIKFLHVCRVPKVLEPLDHVIQFAHEEAQRKLRHRDAIISYRA